MTMTTIVCIVTLIAFVLRIFPHYLSPSGAGVDHWFWKAYIEKYKQDRIFPPVLPQYILDEHQWYPPLFPLLMTYLPEITMSSYSRLVAIFIDMLRLIVLICLIYLLTDGNLLAVFICGLIYATTPILVSYNIQLNPRGLAALFLDILIALLLWYYFANAPAWIWLTVIFVSALILLTHKMTTQLLWFLCLCSGIISQDWKVLALIPASIVTALIISRGFYFKVVRAHWDIITFWNRNWPWLGAHPISESSVYGEKNYESDGKQHKKGLTGIIKHISFLLAYNPSAWLIFFIKVLTGTYKVTAGALPTVSGVMLNTNLSMFYWLFLLLAFMLLFALLTVFVPFMRCLGMGYLYLYNAAFPAALLWGVAFYVSVRDKILWLEFILCLTLSVTCIIVFYRHLKESKTKRVDEKFDEALGYLKQCSKGTVMCLPMQWYDVVAYKTGQPVLYGAHGFGFELIEPVFPRLMITLQEAVNRYDIRYLLTLKGYLPSNFLTELDNKPLLEFGEYQIYHFKS